MDQSGFQGLTPFLLNSKGIGLALFLLFRRNIPIEKECRRRLPAAIAILNKSNYN